MRIAVMTWFHHNNYGSVLQAFALCRQLEEMGHTVEIIQYRHLEKYDLPVSVSLQEELMETVKSKIKNFFNKNIIENVSGAQFKAYREKKFKFTGECRTLSDLEALNEEFDAFICGSDQIWSPLRFDPHYFLDFVCEPDRMIAYAPSLGIDKISDRLIEQQIEKQIKRFKYISVRENSGAEIVSKMIGKKVIDVLDPTLLLEADEWRRYLNAQGQVSEPYLLAYFLEPNASYWKAVYLLSRKLKLQIKTIPIFYADLKREGVITGGISPWQFIEYIENAAYVCTDSFHGVAFSINFGKEFCCFERFKSKDRKNQNCRIYSILDQLGLRNRLYTKERINTFTEKIAYEEVYKKLKQKRKSSQKFLLESLEAVQQYIFLSGDGKNHIYKNNSLCCGCGACATVCPENAIKVKMKQDGFYCACVDEDKCISCGKCQKMCPFQTDSARANLNAGKLYSYKDMDHAVLMKSSSGGIAYRIACLLQDAGYTVAGCAFDVEEQTAKHMLIEPNDKEGLQRLQGSKYMQSNFSVILPELIRQTEPLAIFGTPCQIAGVRNVLRNRRNVIYIDLICHGVPSYLLYKKYKKSLQNKYGMKTEQLQVNFRYKPKGWRDRYIYVADLNKGMIISQSKDEYFRMFIEGGCYSPACYECRWRTECSADLRVGDFWGKRFRKDKTGVSMVLSMTERGQKVIDKLISCGYGANLLQQPLDDYYACQQTQNYLMPTYYEKVLELLRKQETALTDIVSEYVLPFEKRKKVKRRLYGVYKKIKRKTQ